MFRLTKYETVLVLLFLLSLPFSNPWVRGDGVGYYAYARALLIEHRLDFTRDWLAANTSFRMGRTDGQGHILPEQYTAAGHLNNHFSIGPAMLWLPFLITAHSGVLLYDGLGGRVAADGFSKPYVMTMAFATAFYGFLAVFISFRLARKYVPERWAFLATLGIWFGSALPVYMYFNPSWSHALSAFAVAIFLWYWVRTRSARRWTEWIVLGAIGGLMLDVYYPNAVLLLLPLLESIAGYWKSYRALEIERAGRLFLGNVCFAAMLLVTFLPTLITKEVVYGSYLKSGYENLWNWKSPAFFKLCVSADHGLFSWHPILLLAFAGLFCLRKHDRPLGLYLMGVFVALVYTIGCDRDWDGLSSFGNRYFVSITPLFVLGLAASFDWLARAWQERRAAILAASATAVLILWNLGLIFQWGTHLIPPRGAISWRQAAYNQVAVVPERAASTMKAYLTHRTQLMDRIEREDVKQLKARQSEAIE
ncbi:MAG TPA: hypothetical protein VNM68_09870 [Candidatus Polarisedimenticolia bacterium]|nr:hypothetical protein [Candidatus Polarisedimenticolia bacterium]